jgi:magnesium chelatase subunit H
VNDRVTDSSGEPEDELVGTWKSRNAFSYGRNEKGAARSEILDILLKRTGRIVQQIDSVAAILIMKIRESRILIGRGL